MKPTIYDVAREACVSIATVSKVINNTGRISDKTRAKVLKIMEELRYQPSVVASALTGKRTSTIGLLIPDLANPFFAEVARHVEDRGHELGYSVVMCSTDYDTKKEEKYIALLKQKSVDGIILAGFRNDTLLRELTHEKLPIALIAQDIPALIVDSVMIDDYLGGYQATVHLLGLGHRRIAIIEEKDAKSSNERIRGYREALKNAGVPFDDHLVIGSDSTVEGGKRSAAQLLDSNEPPTAFFCCNDLLAIGVIQTARQKGLTIPEDLSVVGFDNTILAEITDPPLTTVNQPIPVMGHQIMDLLIQKIEGKKNTKQKVVVVPELIIRKSTCPPKQ